MNNPKIPNGQIYCFKDTEQIYQYPVAIHMHENHLMWHRINDNIKMAIESGLIAKWNADSQMNLKNVDLSNGSVQLTFEHIFTALALYGVFLGFSVSAFIAELIVYRNARRRQCGKFWKIADMLIDADRHFLKNRK